MSEYTSPPTPDPPAPIRRLTPGFEVEDDGSPGMFYKADGSLWLRDPLGAEVEIGSGNGGDSSVLTATVVLTDADIKTLPTVWPVIVPAPGPDRIIVPVVATLSINWSPADQYTNVSNDFPASVFSLSYSDDFQTATGVVQPSTTLNGDGGTPTGKFVVMEPYLAVTTALTPNQALGFGSSFENLVDQPLKFIAYNTAGNYTGGNPANEMRVTALYSIVTIA